MDDEPPIPEPKHSVFAVWRWPRWVLAVVLVACLVVPPICFVALFNGTHEAWINRWLGFDMEFGP